MTSIWKDLDRPTLRFPDPVPLFTGHFGQDQLSAEAFEAAGAAALPPEHHAALYAQHQPLAYTHDNSQQQQQGQQEQQHISYHASVQAP